MEALGIPRRHRIEFNISDKGVTHESIGKYQVDFARLQLGFDVMIRNLYSIGSFKRLNCKLIFTDSDLAYSRQIKVDILLGPIHGGDLRVFISVSYTHLTLPTKA